MTIDEIIQLLRNRLEFLAIQRKAAYERGDAESVASLDADATVTANSLNQLLSLAS